MPLSTKQMEYLALAWQCFETEPKIDYEKFHKVAGLASAASARELMRVAKNKLKTEYGALSEGMKATNGSSSPITKKTTSTPSSTGKRGRKKAAIEENGGDEEDAEEESPTKKKAKTKKGPKDNRVIKAEKADEDEDGYFLV